ncbi:TPA: hypothetical protein DIC20_01755 [Candidatus Dependentiae bacterium]|nr:MAG: hypothetical protein US03_C0001G0196 [candidate division TM6 bacterium GW2011_GWF2_36_131]KKQ03668.1 MAG: hypothetical protein US13_C0001G0008 [candidate division TM6 bacterium GW2011_GWE2_36_25]KKQ18337.1 MAG: hypothetical protein US32_C0027G0004 [candidate division TM6 bacterium GW2011_GWA2_36_9]HBR70435.1 hypothetical protein [Candidatus Dependentiae bacterium]HCU00411.1 hypothetical protein [Candidatus Dependentiae bacterium]
MKGSLVKKSFLILYLSSFFMLPAMERAIYDKDTIEFAMPYLRWANLVVLDIDNTIMYSSDVPEANCQWCDVAEKRLQEKGFSKAEAFQKMVWGYDYFGQKATMVPSEPKFVEFINDAQKIGIPVIAITGRPDMMREVTVKKLTSIGVYFSHGCFKGSDFKQANGTHFIEGIIYNGYAGSPQKGESLKLFLNTVGLSPKNILMIDDRQHCLESVKTHLPDVNFIGIRYGLCDEAFKSFKPTQEMLDFIDEELTRKTLTFK